MVDTKLFDTKLDAQKRAVEVIRLLPDANWKTRIWENWGKWLYELQISYLSLRECRDGRFSCSIKVDNNPSPLCWYDPNNYYYAVSAIEGALKKAEMCVKQHGEVLQHVKRNLKWK